MGKVSRRRNRSRANGRRKKHRFLMKGGAIFFDGTGNLTPQGTQMKNRVKIFLLMAAIGGWDRGALSINTILGGGAVPTAAQMAQNMAMGGYQSIEAAYGGADYIVRAAATAAYQFATSKSVSAIPPTARAAMNIFSTAGFGGARFLYNNQVNIAQGIGLLIAGLVVMGIPVELVENRFREAGFEASTVAAAARGDTQARVETVGRQIAVAGASVMDAADLANPYDHAAVRGAGDIVLQSLIETAAAFNAAYDRAATVLVLHPIDSMHDRLPVITMMMLATCDAVMETAARSGDMRPIVQVATNAADLAANWISQNARAFCVRMRARAVGARVSAMESLRASAAYVGNWMIDMYGGLQHRWQAAMARRVALNHAVAAADASGAGADAAQHAQALIDEARAVEAEAAAQAGQLVAPPNTPASPASPQAMFIPMSPLDPAMAAAHGLSSGDGNGYLDEARAAAILASLIQAPPEPGTPQRAFVDSRPDQLFPGVAPEDVDQDPDRSNAALMGQWPDSPDRSGASSGGTRGLEKNRPPPKYGQPTKSTGKKSEAMLERAEIIAAFAAFARSNAALRLGPFGLDESGLEIIASEWSSSSCGGGAPGGGGRRTKKAKRHRKRATKKHKKKSHKAKSRRRRR